MGKVYLIGNAHLDPVWQWQWQDGFSEILSTFRSALDRMKDFPEIKFTSACSVYYEWIEKVDPEMFEEIKARVKEGRWDIAGGWFLQPDCNMPSGESFARHALIAQRYFKEKFGITANTGYNVDSFGHSGALPQILKKSGLDNYVFMRPHDCECSFEDDTFIWESDDGSRINAHRIPWYTFFDVTPDERITPLSEKAKKNNNNYMGFYGIGNHGGGPSIRLIHEINKLNLENVQYSTTTEFFNDLNTDGLNVRHTELQHHARGCYSAHSSIKRGNRLCENNLITAEKFAVLANKLTGVPYPHKKLKKAWKNLLFNQFHDILTGCAIKSAYEDAQYLHGETMSITEQIIGFSMQKIMRNIDTLCGESLPQYKNMTTKNHHWKLWEHEVIGTPVVIFNPHSWEVTLPVEIGIPVKSVIDESGANVDFQIIRAEFTDRAKKHGTLFNATVPAYGYTVYRVFTEKESQTNITNSLSITNTSLENDKIKVVFDEKTGEICSYLLKESGKHIINKPCSAILLDETECDTWGHDKDSLGEKIDSFANPSFKIIENGPCRCVLSVTTTAANSTIERKYIIMPNKESIKVKTKVNFNEKHKALKFAFPIENSAVTAGIQYGTVTREQNLGEDFCGAFISANGLCVANTGQYGYDTADNQMRLTILRGAIYTDHHGKDSRDELCEYMDQGIMEFSYMLFPFKSKADAFKKSEELNIPLRYILDSFHEGCLPETKSCFTADSDSFLVSAIKESEDNDGLILRFFEADDTDFDLDAKLFDTDIKTHLSHNEIKTLKISNNEIKEVNLIEW